MEERYQELDRASAIYERWGAVRPEPRVWVKWAEFEEERVKLDKAHEVFQTAHEFFGDDAEQFKKAQAVFNRTYSSVKIERALRRVHQIREAARHPDDARDGYKDWSLSGRADTHTTEDSLPK
ncbi:hypothetical protein DFH11DRAFT_1545803 [Phellopilus nigrolimitatus]|nr:hypothetical protein DFH11DRAFT_1545803 [Phellopilus nigrolimitatus]